MLLTKSIVKFNNHFLIKIPSETKRLNDLSEKEGDEGSYTADGRFEMIRRQLGGYPDNLFIEEHTGPKSLDELVKRHLALGIMNINVHTNK